MKKKIVKFIWVLFAVLVISALVNYNVKTFKEDVTVTCVNKYRPFREHKGQTYYGGDYNLIIKHPLYGYGDIRVDVNTYENHKVNDKLIFSWSQSDLNRHFNNYPDREWLLQLEKIMLLSFALLIMCVILSFILLL